jgi:hypothetical protein
MSIAAEADKKAAHTRGAGPAGGPAPTVPEQGVAPPPRLRRRPVWVVASVAAICLGALLSVWAYTSTSSTREVVAVRSTVHRGGVIPREALMTVRVGVDPALRPVPAEGLGRVAGQRAAMDLSAGGLVTEEAVASSVVPARDMSVVGVSLPAGLMPGEPLLSGDRVRVVATPGEQGDVTAGGQRFIAATVVGTYPDAENGRTVVSVQVPYTSAAELAARAATGRVVLVLDSRER